MIREVSHVCRGKRVISVRAIEVLLSIDKPKVECVHFHFISPILHGEINFLISCLLPWKIGLSRIESAHEGRNLLLKEKFFPVRVDPHLEGRQK